MTGTGTMSGGVLLTGGTGMVGRALSVAFARRGIRVVQAIRGDAPRAGTPTETLLHWQPNAPEPFADTSLLEGLDAAIHLSGANVAGRRWTPAYKEEILQSRKVTTEAVARTLARLSRPPRLLISASATGIYGDRGDELLNEESGPGQGFLSEICQVWEAATHAAVDAGIAVVHLRLGVVFDPAGGALAKVLPLFRAGLGGRLGSGRQWMSWIAIDDVVGAVLHIAGYGDETPGSATGALLRGPVNCVSPVPVTNREYTRALAAILHRPAFAAAPAFALRLAVGEMADAALLSSCRAVPEKLLRSGYRFLYPEIAPALAHLLDR